MPGDEARAHPGGGADIVMRCVNCESASGMTLVLFPEESKALGHALQDDSKVPENLSRSRFRRVPLCVAARLLHKRTISDWALIFDPGFILQNASFKEWSRWDSNPRPPPCKVGATYAAACHQVSVIGYSRPDTAFNEPR